MDKGEKKKKSPRETKALSFLTERLIKKFEDVIFSPRKKRKQFCLNLNFRSTRKRRLWVGYFETGEFFCCCFRAKARIFFVYVTGVACFFFFSQLSRWNSISFRSLRLQPYFVFPNSHQLVDWKLEHWESFDHHFRDIWPQQILTNYVFTVKSSLNGSVIKWLGRYQPIETVSELETRIPPRIN